MTDALGPVDTIGVELRQLHVSRIRMESTEAAGRRSDFAVTTLTAEGDDEALDLVRNFLHASWLDDLSLPFLDALVNLQGEKGGFVHLREEGWATLADDGQRVHVSDQPFAESYAIVDWQEFQQVVLLKRQFLQLMQHFQGQGIPRYSPAEGFRVRLHAPGHLPPGDAII